MADNLSSRSSETRYPGGDPFAELSRIIGRGAEQPAARDSAEDEAGYDFDLERELLGEMEPEALQPDEVRYAQPDASPAASAEGGFEPPADQPFVDPLADEFADAFAAEFGSDASWRSGEAAENDPGAWNAEPAEQAPVAGPVPLEVEAALADVDLDFGDIDFTDELPALEDEPLDAPASESAPAAEAVAAAAPLSLEDELSAMLTGGSDAPWDAGATHELAPAPAQEAPIYAEPAQEWQSAEDNAAYAEEEPEATNEPVADWRNDDLPAFENALQGDEHAVQSPVYDNQPYEAAIAADAQDYELVPYESGDYQPVDAAGYEQAPYDQASYEPQSYEPVEADAYQPVEAGEYKPVEAEVAPEEPQAAPDPFAVLASIAPAAPVFAESLRRSTPIAPVAPPAAAPSAQEPDDDFYATVPVAESAVPVQDDLDLPEIEYQDEPAPVALDPDFDFGELTLEPQQPAPEPAPQPTEARYERGAYSIDEDRLSPHSDDDLYAEFTGQPDAVPAEDLPAYAPAVEPAPERQDRSKGMLIAAVVAGVAVLGGIGAFALSFGGDSAGDVPTLVRADSEPLKVKPENPGGVSVPNQDSQAYQRVAEGQATARPQQESLVSTAEEPVSLAERALPANGLPGVDDELVELDEAPPAVTKTEDRIAPAVEPDGVGTDRDLVAVQPRRVRTMVVRPDGTLVPREETAAPLVAAAPESTTPQMLTPEATAPASPQAAQDSMPAPRAVETVRITQEEQPTPSAALATPAPAERAAAPAPAPQPAAAPERPTQVAQAAAPARNEPAAPAPAAASEWSMQIASQPTAEGAQATYQDLARRYGSVIGGRGVNIVRADIPGKGTYYRVRIPSSTRAEAVSMCERYKAAGGSCFVSK